MGDNSDGAESMANTFFIPQIGLPNMELSQAQAHIFWWVQTLS